MIYCRRSIIVAGPRFGLFIALPTVIRCHFQLEFQWWWGKWSRLVINVCGVVANSSIRLEWFGQFFNKKLIGNNRLDRLIAQSLPTAFEWYCEILSVYVLFLAENRIQKIAPLGLEMISNPPPPLDHLSCILLPQKSQNQSHTHLTWPRMISQSESFVLLWLFSPEFPFQTTKLSSKIEMVDFSKEQLRVGMDTFTATWSPPVEPNPPNEAIAQVWFDSDSPFIRHSNGMFYWPMSHFAKSTQFNLCSMWCFDQLHCSNNGWMRVVAVISTK